MALQAFHYKNLPYYKAYSFLSVTIDHGGLNLKGPLGQESEFKDQLAAGARPGGFFNPFRHRTKQPFAHTARARLPRPRRGSGCLPMPSHTSQESLAVALCAQLACRQV